MVEGRSLTIRTDHKSLIFAFRQKPEKTSQRQLRQLDYIRQFTTYIVHIAGEETDTADVLSRAESIDMLSNITTER